MLTSTIKRNAFRVVATLAFAAAPAFASMIIVNNFSFETLPVGGLTFHDCGTVCSYSLATILIPIPGWSSTPSSTSGQFQPGGPTSAANVFFTSLPDGATSAFANTFGTMSQTIAGESVGLGTVYTLSVDIGHRGDATNVFMGGSADLMLGSTRCDAIGSDPGAGNWGIFTATCTGTSANAGLPIKIELQTIGQVGNTNVFGTGNFDNVRLDGSAPNGVPEPASFLLIGSALLALRAFRRRRPIA